MSIFVHNSTMMIEPGQIPFHTTDWNTIEPTVHPGTTGTAYWRTLEFNGLRIRHVQYSPQYLADHWCSKGHILYCLQGEMISELANGQQFKLTAGMSYQVSDNMSEHRTYTETGCTLFVIDGAFLQPTQP